jgi:Ni,Fe-hydrogenase maturation factor
LSFFLYPRFCAFSLCVLCDLCGKIERMKAKSMPNLPQALRSSLKGAARVAVLVLGSSLRGDDAAGLLVADALDEARKKPKGAIPVSRQGGCPRFAPLRNGGCTRRTERDSPSPPRVQPLLKVFRGETAPENLTGPIKALRPTHLVVIDAADFGARPGAARILAHDAAPATCTEGGAGEGPAGSEVGRLAGGVSFSTHNLPVGVLTEYLRHSIGCACVVIGIQPGSCEFGKEPSPAIHRAAERTAAAILKALI